MKGYNKNRQKFNVQLSDGTNNISFEQMWALNQASKSPRFTPNPLAKAYTPSFGLGGVLSAAAPFAAMIPGWGTAASAVLGLGGGLLESAENKKATAFKPTTGMNSNQYGYATGGSMEPISPNAMEVTGAPNETDGNQINYKGQPINVDHGEVIDHSKDIVFSDKLFDPRSGKSFADTVKPMEKLIGKLSKMPSNINNNTIKALEQQKQKVFQTQEQVAAALGQRNSDGSTVQPGQPAMASGGRIKSYTSGGVPDLTQFFLGKPYQSSQQYASNIEPYIEEPSKPKSTFKYAKGYQSYADLDLDRDDVQKQVEAFFASDAGQRYQRAQRGKNPKWNFYGSNQDANNTIGPKFAHLLADPEFQKLYRTSINTPPTTAKKEVYGNNPILPIQEAGGYNAVLKPTNRYSKPSYADEAQSTYDTDRENARLAGTTEDNKRPGSEPFDAKGAINQFFKDNPNSAQPLKKPSKFGLGDYLQLGAAGASVIGALLDKPEKQKPNLDRTQITQNRYDPANALMQNQYTTNAGMMANTNNYSSAGVQAGLQNLMANKYRADSQVQSQYDQMNQQARTQYEQRLQQQNQFNAQTLSANDDKNVANRAAYTNNLYGALQTVSQVGAGFNDKKAMNIYLKTLAQRDPQASAGILNNDGKLVSEVDPKNVGKVLQSDGTYKWSGGKIKLRKRR